MSEKEVTELSSTYFHKMALDLVLGMMEEFSLRHLKGLSCYLFRVGTEKIKCYKGTGKVRHIG